MPLGATERVKGQPSSSVQVQMCYLLSAISFSLLGENDLDELGNAPL
jgi:hypothetical protein